MYFSNIIEALGHTPLVEMSNIVSKPKVRIFAKLEGQNPGGSASTKDRVARYMIEKAEQDGRLTAGKTILEATSGNTGIALAWLGHKKGYKVTIIMPENMSCERQQLIRLFGAELILTSAAGGVNNSIEVAAGMAANDSKYFMPDQFSNPANPLAHYETTGVEIIEDIPCDKVDYLVAGIGTGGTIVGTTRRLKEQYPGIRACGVEPPPGDSIQGLRCLEAYVPPILDLNLVTDRANVTSRQAAASTKLLLEKEGIFAGMSSGALIHQALEIASGIDEGNIVAILPDGGWKYLSLDLWS